jgi:hypothetical protein
MSASLVPVDVPRWQLEVTNCNPDRPRGPGRARTPAAGAVFAGGKVQAEDLQAAVSALTPEAIRACTFTVRPLSRTVWVSASIHMDAYGLASSGHDRQLAATSSSSGAITLTCDMLSFVTARLSASFSARRVETPGRYDVATTVASARSARRASPAVTPGNKCAAAASGSPAPPSSPGVSLLPPVPVQEFARSGLTSP